MMEEKKYRKKVQKEGIKKLIAINPWLSEISKHNRQ